MERSGTLLKSGLWLAAMTATISGVAIFLNGYGVRAWSGAADATTYTTLKNMVAALVLLAVGATVARSGPVRTVRSLDRRRRWMLTGIALIGGSIPFVLFFEGLARAESAQAAFIHKTLVVWVAILAPVFLKERVRWQHLAAIGLLMWGQVTLVSEFEPISFGPGEWMILLATLLWSVEVILAKRVMADVPPALVARVRMVGGSIVLLAYFFVRGAAVDLSVLTPVHLVWIVVTGVSLSAYVITWFLALSRAPALDVTAILVGGALITALLQSWLAGAALPSPLGVALVAGGMGVILALAWKPKSSAARA
jgi:drug/metabolite transporter (DMT)-like permease